VQRLYDAGRAPVDANREGGEGGEGGETDGAPPGDAAEDLGTVVDAASE
jgi:hypothetical protein